MWVEGEGLQHNCLFRADMTHPEVSGVQVPGGRGVHPLLCRGLIAVYDNIVNQHSRDFPYWLPGYSDGRRIDSLH